MRKNWRKGRYLAIRSQLYHLGKYSQALFPLSSRSGSPGRDRA
jgi:hypothetical protein